MIPLRRVPALFIATTFTFGGLWPLWDAKAAVLAFGLPERVASSSEAQSVMIVYSSRMTVIGLVLYTFYYRRMYSAIDIIMVFLGWAGVVDGYVCWMENVPGKAVFRLLSSVVIAALGGMRITGGQ